MKLSYILKNLLNQKNQKQTEEHINEIKNQIQEKYKKTQEEVFPKFIKIFKNLLNYNETLGLESFVAEHKSLQQRIEFYGQVKVT